MFTNFNVGEMKAEAMRKAFGIDIEKGRTGVYEDNAENRRLNRVGQPYGHKKQEEAPKGRQAAKQEVPAGDKRGATEATSVAKHAEGASDEALKRAAADPKAAPEVKAAAEAEMKKRGTRKTVDSEDNTPEYYLETAKNQLTDAEEQIKKIEGELKKEGDPESENAGFLKDLLNSAKRHHDRIAKRIKQYEQEIKANEEDGDVDLTLDEVANILDVDGDMREVVLDYFSREPAWAEEHGATKEQMEFCEKLEKLGAKISPKSYDWSEAEKAEAYERRMNKKGYEMFNVYDGDMYIWLMVPSDKLKN